MRGHDARTLQALAERLDDSVAGRARRRGRGPERPRDRSPSWRVQVNRGLAGTLGVTVAQVAQALRPAFAGVDAGDWVDPRGETRKVRVRLRPEARRRVADLERLPLTVGGRQSASAAPCCRSARSRRSRRGSDPRRSRTSTATTWSYVQANWPGRSAGRSHRATSQAAHRPHDAAAGLLHLPGRRGQGPAATSSRAFSRRWASPCC